MPARAIRIGHAFCGEAALDDALKVIGGRERLSPRSPRDPRAVFDTEATLGYGRSRRPVYGYLGDLHPALGTVGVVVERSWCRSLNGISRCDSGGLGSRKGAFATLSQTEATRALIELSFRGDALASWEPAFDAEVSSSFADHKAYVLGAEPDTTSWSDARRVCFTSSSPPRDRRLWTWEARFDDGPDVGDFVALALSPTSHALIEQRIIDGALDLPESIRVLVGDTSAEGVQFHQPRVRELLAGAQ